MSDVRDDLTKTAEELRKMVAEAAYVAVGLGVVGAQKAKIARHRLLEELRRAEETGAPGDARSQLARAAREIDSALTQLVTTGSQPVAARLPEELRRIIRQAQAGGEQLRHWMAERFAA